MRAILALADGTYFEGESFDAPGEALGEVVFNTSMMGYQEILTDPSYRGQLVTMTYPLIGNYGVNDEDIESHRPWVEGFIVKECSPVVSNWRANRSLPEFMHEHGIVGIQNIDTPRPDSTHPQSRGSGRHYFNRGIRSGHLGGAGSGLAQFERPRLGAGCHLQSILRLAGNAVCLCPRRTPDWGHAVYRGVRLRH